MPFASVQTISAFSRCNEFHARMRDYIVASKQITTIIIGANWSIYLQCATSQLDRRADGSCGFLTDATRAMADELRGYLAAGKRIVVVTQVPGMPWQVPLEMQHRRLLAEDWRDIAVAPVNSVASDALLSNLLAEIPQIKQVDPAKTLCSDGLCTASRSGVPLYFDEAHLSGHGAELVLPDLLAALVQPD